VSTLAYINPQMLTWAREAQGLKLADVEERANLKKVSSWEAGQEKPTMVQLRALSHLYRRPSALFYFPHPPARPPRPQDFRSVQDKSERPLGTETLTELRLCESRRRSALELAELLGVDARTSLPAIDDNDDLETIASVVRSALGIPDAPRVKDDKELLALWIAALENANVLVFRSITLHGQNSSFREIRGSSAWFDEFPWMLLNSQEHPHGQLFTLAHELAHLLLHGSGLCTLDEEDGSAEGRQERYCNSLAAALLMPRELVQVHVGSGQLTFAPSEALDRGLAFLQRQFHTSREAIARRLVTLGLTEWSNYHRIREEQIRLLQAEREQSREEAEGGGGPYYHLRVLKWNGAKYAGLVIEAFHQGKLSLGGAAGALRTKVNHFETLRRELYG